METGRGSILTLDGILKRAFRPKWNNAMVSEGRASLPHLRILLIYTFAATEKALWRAGNIPCATWDLSWTSHPNKLKGIWGMPPRLKETTGLSQD